LRRIEKLLDTDLERPADVFGLDLALRILAAHGDRITGSDGSG
jgi:DNA-binding PucR family transcriptional regulator